VGYGDNGEDYADADDDSFFFIFELGIVGREVS
jgi:hypothetical protein